MDEFARAIPSSQGAAARAQSSHSSSEFHGGASRRGGYDGYGESNQAGRAESVGRSQHQVDRSRTTHHIGGGYAAAADSSSGTSNYDGSSSGRHGTSFEGHQQPRWQRDGGYQREEQRSERWQRDGGYQREEQRSERWQRDGGYQREEQRSDRWQRDGGYQREEQRSDRWQRGHSDESRQYSEPEYGAQEAHASRQQASSSSMVAHSAELPDITDGSALLHRYLSTSTHEELLNKIWFDVDGYISVVVLRSGELHSDPCAVVQFESPAHARGVLNEIKGGSARALTRALQSASADSSRQPWLATYHPPRALRSQAAESSHPVSSVQVARPKGVGLAPSTPHRFTPDSTVYSLDSSTGMFWDGTLGWYACPRGHSVLYLHAATGQYATFNGIDFLPFTPAAPTEAPPAVDLLPDTPGGGVLLDSGAAEGSKPQLSCSGSGYAVQRRRGVLLCALCRRRFRDVRTLTEHLQRSSLHAGNVRKVQASLQATGNTAALKSLRGLVQSS